MFVLPFALNKAGSFKTLTNKCFLAFPGSLGGELAHLLFHLRGVAFGTGDLAGLEFLEAQDTRKLFPALKASIFIGGHDTSSWALVILSKYNNFSVYKQGWPPQGVKFLTRWPVTPPDSPIGLTQTAAAPSRIPNSGPP